MKKALFFITAFLLTGTYIFSVGQNTNYSMQLDAGQKPTRSVEIKIDISNTDNSAVVNQNSLEAVMRNKLTGAKFSISNDTNGSYLLLRINNLVVKGIVSSFVQLSYNEPATLQRTGQTLHALTWSSATLLASEPKDTEAEVEKIVVKMVDGFLSQYDAVYAPEK